MLYHAITTPCPIASSLDQFLSLNDNETTTSIDFTTEFRASVRNVKPRRFGKSSIQFAIHEDEEAGNIGGRPVGTKLLQAPRRAQIVPKNRPSEGCQQSLLVESTRTQRKSPSLVSLAGEAPKRSNGRPSIRPESDVGLSSQRIRSPPTLVPRPTRRGTIYIPNEDTTMPSIHMGIFSPIKDFDFQPASAECHDRSVEMTGIAAQMAMKRAARTSIISGGPRRGVLCSSSRPLQETVIQEDRMGSGDGKENIPPSHPSKATVSAYASAKSTSPSVKGPAMTKTSFVAPQHTNVYNATKCSTIKSESTKVPETRQSNIKPAWNRGSRFKQVNARPDVHKLPKPEMPPLFDTAAHKEKVTQVPSRFVIPIVPMEAAPQIYGILKDDISTPSMYEENWLQHQEIVITQLLNNLFLASSSESGYDHQDFRRRLLQLHCSSDYGLLQTRLKAALLYGSLGIPQEILDTGTRLQNDIGLRKRFTDLWLCTYNLEALRSGLEVVIGRECQSDNYRMSASTSSLSKINKSVLRNFIEAFLIRNEDAKPESHSVNRVAWAYQRTLLRSLLLIKLMDATKSEKSINMKKRLFQHSSPFKASTSVVQSLFQMLNPSAGDPVRSLGHIDYVVSHTQNPLVEFNYQIENLAVDLRDGVRLTRLVEILLYPSSSQALDKQFDAGTTTLFMPEGEVLEFEDGKDWPLSQHLKTLSQSRAVRLWNVHLALSALTHVKGINALCSGITTDDIVDGHREKTIQLLWALIGKWGLRGLINWEDLRWEIGRLERTCGDIHLRDLEADEFDTDDLSFTACKALLRRWCRAVAASHGLTIRNFTTSFADGKAFKVIVDEYEPYLQTDASQCCKPTSLEERLVRLGCSAQFSHLFAAHNSTHVFDRDFVLAALAFLCSRLLAPTLQSRAATVIQQAWRQRCRKVERTQNRDTSPSTMPHNAAAFAVADVAVLESEAPKVSAMAGTNIPNEVVTPVTLTNRHDISSPISSAEDIWLTLALPKTRKSGHRLA